MTLSTTSSSSYDETIVIRLLLRPVCRLSIRCAITVSSKSTAGSSSEAIASGSTTSSPSATAFSVWLRGLDVVSQAGSDGRSKAGGSS